MRILNILKTAPDGSTKKIIEIQSVGNEVTIVDLTADNVPYDRLVADIFAHDKVYCW